MLAKGLAKTPVIIDSAEPKSIEEIKRKGVRKATPSVKGKDSVLFGIQKLQGYRIVVDPRCENMITALENYAWKKDKKTGEYIDEPDHTFSHCCDALRYGIQVMNGNKLKSINKKMLF